MDKTEQKQVYLSPTRRNTILVVLMFFGLGLGLPLFSPWKWLTSESIFIYQSEYNPVASSTTISWQQLLGTQDKALLSELREKQEQLSAQFPQGSDLSMESQLLASALTAQTWKSLDGYQINEGVVGQYVSLPGFLVPLELNEGKVTSFFIVPYYGACLHYPPPPPNQIVYVQLAVALPLPAMEKAYEFRGLLKQTLFEDPLGTSVWGMAVSTISEYSAPTDDVRVH